jgi:hypothetical protein
MATMPSVNGDSGWWKGTLVRDVAEAVSTGINMRDQICRGVTFLPLQMKGAIHWSRNKDEREVCGVACGSRVMEVANVAQLSVCKS